MQKRTSTLKLSVTEKEKKEFQMDAIKNKTSISKLLTESYKELKQLKKTYPLLTQK